MDTYFDLGGHRFPVTTQSTEAQTWFDRGLLWTYGYNHEEAVTCFERAIGDRNAPWPIGEQDMRRGQITTCHGSYLTMPAVRQPRGTGILMLARRLI